MRKTGIACAVIAVVSAVSAGSGADAADVSQPIAVPTTPGCSPGYSWQRMPVRYQCATPQPTCAYGFASGPSWNGSAWVYSCNAPPPPPPPPSCASGMNQTVAPSWNGTAWVGQVCKPVAPVIKPPAAMCQDRASQDGMTLGKQTFARKFTSSAGPATQYTYGLSTGPMWDTGSQQGNSWSIACSFVQATGDWVPAGDTPYTRTPNFGSCVDAGCGG